MSDINQLKVTPIISDVLQWIWSEIVEVACEGVSLIRYCSSTPENKVQ